MGGLEPTNNGVKIRCLTTWLHPIKPCILYTERYKKKKNSNKIGQGGIRTPDTVVRSHVL